MLHSIVSRQSERHAAPSFDSGRAALSLLAGVALLSALGLSACGKKASPAPQPSDDEPITFNETITWHEHIAPLVAEKCGGCHSEGGIGPFSIETYEEAHMWAPQMERDIKSGAMPPWGAQDTDECTPPGKFKEDLRLSRLEKAMFSQWILDGRLEGDPQDAAPLPTPPSLDLHDPDRMLTIPSAVSVEGANDAFVCFTLDPEITEPVWLTGSQVVPGNSKVAHHALLFLDREGDGAEFADENGQYPCFGGPGVDSPVLLAAWAPGSVPSVTPDNTGTPLLPGDRLVVQMHYHPVGSGVETDDSTRIDLTWTNQEPDYVSNIFLIGNFETADEDWQGGKGYGLTTGPDFLIPAGADNHVEINRFLLPGGEDPLNRLVPLSLWVVGTHMHYVGTDMKITQTDPGGKQQCLVQTPAWDFNWQRGYFFDGPVEKMPKLRLGDSLTMRCTYNNSLTNPFVRTALDEQGLEEPVDVRLGEESLDEMCLGIFGLAVPKEYKAAIGL